MFKLVWVLLFFAQINFAGFSQIASYPEKKVLDHYRCKKSVCFSTSSLHSKIASQEIKLLDTLSNANCILVECKHKQGNYALLTKKGKRYKLLYLNFKEKNAKPYFINDSIDFNRDTKNEVLLYFTGTVTALPNYSAFNGSKTGLHIISITKRRVLLNCDLTLCGIGSNKSNGAQVSACFYQYAASYMPLRVIITAFAEKGSLLPLIPPQVTSYQLKRTYFVRTKL